MRKNQNIFALGTAFTFLTLVLTLASANAMHFAYAQGGELDPGTPGEVGTSNNTEPDYKPLNLTGPETIQSLEGIEGSNAGFFANDSSISNPNNTAADSIDINQQEACIGVANQSSSDCI